MGLDAAKAQALWDEVVSKNGIESCYSSQQAAVSANEAAEFYEAANYFRAR